MPLLRQIITSVFSSPKHHQSNFRLTCSLSSILIKIPSSVVSLLLIVDTGININQQNEMMNLLVKSMILAAHNQYNLFVNITVKFVYHYKQIISTCIIWRIYIIHFILLEYDFNKCLGSILSPLINVFPILFSSFDYVLYLV